MTTDHREADKFSLYHLSYLGIIDVTGDDAAPFLQGQLTCNIAELTDAKAGLAASCNPQGRVISVLLVVKIPSGFLLILPSSLVEKVLKKLQMYVLRSKVNLAINGDKRILGLNCSDAADAMNLSSADFDCDQSPGEIYVKLPSMRLRYLAVVDSDEDLDLAHFSVGTEDEWRYQDISNGFPWFDLEHSEKYIPQMLDIDRLGGVSFNKGCYTGQEIIARTHYLGKAKRRLFLAECKRVSHFDGNMAVKNVQTQENVGDILTLQSMGNITRMLVVLQTIDDDIKNLILDDAEHTPLTLSPF